MEPVARFKGWLRHDLGDSSSVVLLTQPIMRDDVSELAPLDHWAMGSSLSPLDFATGGYAQAWQLQYQYMPGTDWLVRVGGFRNDLNSLLLDLEDPAWAPGVPAELIGSGCMQGAEAEFETWLGSNFSAAVVGRYTTSSNDDLGGIDLPYVPEFMVDSRLDYLDRSGWRIGLNWQHVGSRFADLANEMELGSDDYLNLYVNKQFNLHLNTFVRLDNVFDEADGFYLGYPSRGRTFRAGLEYRF
jgi:outer membrane cobalamin receptor